MAALGAFVAAMAVAGCTAASSGMHGSRAELYDSISALAAASTNVVLVTVDEQEIVGKEAATVTQSTIRVDDVLSPASLRSNPSQEGVEKLSVGDVASVVQLGSVDLSATPAPILAVGKQYLLFLGAPSDSGAYWISGGDAGIFVPDRTGFHQVQDSEDSFPTAITLEDLR